MLSSLFNYSEVSLSLLILIIMTTTNIGTNYLSFSCLKNIFNVILHCYLRETEPSHWCVLHLFASAGLGLASTWVEGTWLFELSLRFPRVSVSGSWNQELELGLNTDVLTRVVDILTASQKLILYSNHR